MARDTRRLRLRAVWLLVLPFLWFARPTPWLLVVGGALAAPGLLLRAWAAGVIQKERVLTVTGPYAYTRHPLYVGSLFLGLGVTVAGGHWLWPALFLVFFGTVYRKTMAGEAALLQDLFGEAYQVYAGNVPALLPRLTAWNGGAEGVRFTWARYRRNREWEAGLGALAAFVFLAWRWWSGV